MNFNDQDEIEIRFSGTGGQGLVLASIILGEAMVKEGFNVIQGESHGIEARGTATRGEIIASKKEIYNLSVELPDIFVSISQDACTKYYKQIKKNALVIVDSSMVNDLPTFNSKSVYVFPFTELLKERLNTTLPTNIAFLGTLIGLTNLTPVRTMEKAILNRVPKGSGSMNLKAFRLGLELAKGAKTLGT